MDSSCFVPPDIDELCKRLGFPNTDHYRRGWVRIPVKGSELGPEWKDYTFYLDAWTVSLPGSLITNFKKPSIYTDRPEGLRKQFARYTWPKDWFILHPDDPSKIVNIKRIIVEVRGMRAYLDAVLGQGGFTKHLIRGECDGKGNMRLLIGLDAYSSLLEHAGCPKGGGYITNANKWDALRFVIKKAIEVSNEDRLSKHRTARACGLSTRNYGISAEDDSNSRFRKSTELNVIQLSYLTI